MLKRFYSKRSGFTLVEIVVAFAIFAIMSSMVAQILDLAIKARQSNNLYAQELARQEQMLTLIQKDSANFDSTGSKGTYSITIGSDTYTMDYQSKATDPTATNQAEGINYFLSPVAYDSVGSGSSSEESGGPTIGGMSQASRMDTRLTGTEGLGYIQVYQVVKDTYAYPAGHPFELPTGHTRYFIEVAAAGIDYVTNADTLRAENVPYAQYRMFFYHTNDLDEAASQANGLDVYKQAQIVEVGHIDTPFHTISGGLDESITKDGSDVTHTDNVNPYNAMQMGNNCVRISTPYVNSGWSQSTRGVRFQLSKPTRFYVEFVGDPEITVASFGYNGKADGSAMIYEPCPMYKSEYNDDGTPTYAEQEDGSTFDCLYGGYMYTKRPETTT